MDATAPIRDADLPLERDLFLRSLLRELAGTLESVVGIEEASGYISVVGAAIGEQIDTAYRDAIHVDRLNRDQVSAVLVDLKRRIQGDFHVLEEAEDRIVLGNRSCPFGTFVEGRPSLCMMTSNVFGSIAAQNLGYARVEIEQSIAAGDQGAGSWYIFGPLPKPSCMRASTFDGSAEWQAAIGRSSSTCSQSRSSSCRQAAWSWRQTPPHAASMAPTPPGLISRR